MSIVKTETLALRRGNREPRCTALISLAAASFIDRGEDQTLGILWPHMQQSLGASVGGLGPILGLSRLVNTLLLPLWGYATDRWSRRLLLVWFSGLWGVWTLAISLVDTLGQLLVVRLVSSIGLGAFTPAAFSLIGDLYPNGRRGRAAGIIQAVGVIGSLIAFGVLPALAAWGPDAWRLGFVLLGVASCGTGALLFVGVVEPSRGAGESELRGIVAVPIATRASTMRSDLRELLAIPSWRLLAVTEALRNVGTTLFGSWMFTWLAGLGLGSRTFVVAIMSALGIIIGSVVFGVLGDRLDQRFPRYGRLALILGGTIWTLPTTVLFLSSDGHDLVGLVGVGMLASLGGAVAVVLWPMGQAIVPPQLRGSSRALSDMLAGVLGAAALAISGSFADRLGVAPMLLLLAPLPTIASILLWVPMFRTYPRDRAALQHRLAQQRAASLEHSAT